MTPNESDRRSQGNGRSISPSLAPIVEQLELERPHVVTVDEIEALAEQANVGSPGAVVAHRLAERGWLSSTEVRGVWEFIPAERAGAITSGDRLITLRAVLKKHDVEVALALGSALWMLDVAERAPDQHEVAVPSDEHLPAALKRSYRVVRHTAHLPPAEIAEIPVHCPGTVLVHLAHRPTHVKSWSDVLNNLAELVDFTTEDEVRTELKERPHATWIRLAYLLDGVAPGLVTQLEIEPKSKVWFGPRQELRRHNAKWKVADTVLPFSPTDLGS